MTHWKCNSGILAFLHVTIAREEYVDKSKTEREKRKENVLRTHVIKKTPVSIFNNVPQI